MKLWQKDNTGNVNAQVELFTAGRDREMDLQLALADVTGTMAHSVMLESVGLLTTDELAAIKKGLKKIYRSIPEGKFILEEGIEDIHSQVELLLTRELGDTGKKVHSARSRNDQVLVDIRLFLRGEVENLVGEISSCFRLLIAQSEKYHDHLLPGYTHLQLAMPSSFGLWFGAYAESLVDDVITLQAAYRVINKNPLGSAAGYGSSFPVNRTLTTQLLGFEDLNYNVVYAQMGRGKTERIVAQALANVADTLARLSMDACLFLNQNFGFISFPPELTTGSSIMPHKKNPDVLELVRARCNRLKALPNEIMLITTNLPSGYQRDLQLIKEHLFPAFAELKDCLAMVQLMIGNITISENILADEKYRFAFSVEEVNKLVLQGMPFRDAYKKVGEDIQKGKFTYDTNISHTHEGSIGNLCNAQVSKLMDDAIKSFDFEKPRNAVERLMADH